MTMTKERLEEIALEFAVRKETPAMVNELLSAAHDSIRYREALERITTRCEDCWGEIPPSIRSYTELARAALESK